MERVDVADNEQNAEINDCHFDEGEEHGCAGVQGKELILALSASNWSCGDSDRKRNGVDG